MDGVPVDRGFFADRGSLRADDYLELTYRFECVDDPEAAAAHLCQEMSTAQWRRVGQDEDFRPRHAARVLALSVLDRSARSLMAAPWFAAREYACCQVTLAYPHVNFGPRLPNLLTVICGEGAFHAPGINAIKLVDIEFPAPFLAAFQGPQFGVPGVRALLQIQDRPLFFGVVKPNVGLRPEDFAELAYQSWLGGLDAPKDDEMLADTSYSPLARRAELLAPLLKRAEDRTGERKWFVLNITDEVDRLQDHHDLASRHGLGAVMLNGHTTGLSAVRALRRRATLPLVAHFDMAAPLSRLPHFGIASSVLTVLQRVAGFDAIILPGFGRRMQTPEEEVLANVQACLRPLGALRPALPVPGGSDWAGSLPGMLSRLGTRDFGLVPGRGVFGHPDGPEAGARSLREAWEAVSRSVSLEEYARDHPALAAAIRAFGPVL
ncbi:MAG: ribulose 1,5-bisphosphate carboxylase [Planctomycetes bacterium]|nr:ribulose 1,5-bisphosphate carboxylase [Planctomycetota bacterium]